MSFSFLKTGADSARLAQQAEAEIEMKKETKGKLWRFFIAQNKATNTSEDARITFIDGELSSEGFLIPPRWYEHMEMLNGSWDNFICPQKTDPRQYQDCPLCESGKNPAIVAAFTIIDHRTYVSKKGEKYNNTRKLFIAKSQTFEILNKMAVKRGGLAGCTFDVSRTGDKSAAVGNVFDFVEKRPIEELQAMFVREVVDPKTNGKSMESYFVPANYEEEMVFRTPDELRKLGFGTKSSILSPGGNKIKSANNYANEL